ncbi:hypothetical protein NQ314_020248 [Rhamnusium bicolor]|uniref:Uncharacterized protein n=1 Tax=Rhamnusium bicolor TaxID=1586634 RepID=A0AAV8WLB6_9CUCU|nr:hypothetical protein NQ314_020248 [Rhamnusium bicolor]
MTVVLPIYKNDRNFIKRFPRGTYKKNPSSPKYSSTWDSYPVLEYLGKQYPLGNLSLQDLILKLVTLLALISGHRMQTITKIMISSIRIGPGRLAIHVTGRIKTSSMRNTQTTIIIPFFSNKPNLCLASFYHLKIQFTQQRRKASVGGLSRSYKKSGIDTSIYSSHNTLHAVTSVAFRGEVNIEEIRKTAG